MVIFMKNKAFIIVFTIVLSLCPVITVCADDVYEGKCYVDIDSKDKKVEKIAAPNINASAVLIMDAESGRVLYEKNARVRRSMASTTKIMTAIVAIENADLEEVVTVSKRAAQVNGSVINLRQGEELTLKDLLYGLMLQSGNDAAIAIAEHVGGSVEEFCEMMNRKAVSLGAANTHFTSPHGLDMPEHYTTAYELARITAYALKNPIFNELVSTKEANAANRYLYNTNELLGVYPGVDGVKTGYTGQAGRCLVTSATKNQMRIISVVLGSPTRTARAQSSTNLLNYAFSNYHLSTIATKNEAVDSIKVDRGITQNVTACIENEVKLPLRNDELKNLNKVIDLPREIPAPVEKGQEVGNVRWLLNGQELIKSPIVAASDIRKKNFYDYFKDLLGELGKLTK